MLKYDNTVSSTVDGKPIYGAQVTIFTADEPSNPQVATIYSDEAGTIPLSQPILTDQLGYFAFYIGDGKYDIRVMTGAVEISRTNITMVDTLSLKQRALVVPVNEDSGTLPPAGERAGKLLGFDSEGAPSMAVPNSFEGPPGPAGNVAATLAQLKSAPTTNGTMIASYDDSGSTMTWTLGNYSTLSAQRPQDYVQADGIPLTTGAWVRQGSASIAYQEPVEGSLPRSLLAKQLDRNLSPFEFMSQAQQSDVRNRTLSLDVTAALQECFLRARLADRTVEMPDGKYLTGNLEFGTNNTLAQSGSPTGLIGTTRSGATLVAKPGTVGTLLKSWSLAGVTFRDFNIDTIGTAAQAWDCDWKAGQGPSTQNIIENIIISAGSAPLHVSLRDLNDTYPTNITVRTTDVTGASCGIDATQSGGLNIIRNCILSGCYLRFGAQNGVIDSCWMFGVEFSQACLNYVDIIAGYVYANEANDAMFWSESFEPQQSVRALRFSGTQLITENADVAGYFNLNAYSTIALNECQFLGIVGRPINLLGPDCRKDSAADVLVAIRGGSHEGALVLNDRSGFAYPDAIGFINDQTAQRVSKSYTYPITPTVSGIAAAVATGEVHRTGNQVRADFRVTWSGQTPTGPLIVTLPQINLGPDTVVSIGYPGNAFDGTVPFATMGNNSATIAFYAANGSQLNASASGDLIMSVNYRIAA